MSLRWSMIQEAERAAMCRRFGADLAADELVAGEAPVPAEMLSARGLSAGIGA